MPQETRNIIEDIIRDFLNSSLYLRYDICTCQECKEEMLQIALSKIPPKYVTPQEAAIHTVIEQARAEQQAEITRAVIGALETVSKNSPHNLSGKRKADFRLLLEKIFEERGLDFRQYREEILKRKVALRMRTNNAASYVEYLKVLTKKPEEYDKLFEALCINVSEFFRDSQVWVTLRYLLEKIIKEKIEKNDNLLKIWSAGCAGGEEPYSLAILLKEVFKSINTDIPVEIYGTDIDKDCLRLAQAGRYSKDALKNVNEDYLKDYFVVSEGYWRLKEEVRKMVKFRSLDLVSQETVRDNDIAVCRNVFIYFNRPLQEELLRKFHASLKSGGYLIMGRTELIFSEAKDEIFKNIDPNARIYQKK